MKKLQKKAILDLMSLLSQLTFKMRQLQNAQDLASVQMILQTVQQQLRSLSGQVRESEGDCDIAEELQILADSAPEMTADDLGEAIESVRMDIREGIRANREMVFLPYKAAMWDSLESIYLAAKEDPTLDLYVVPIPYYEKNADDSYRSLNYDGALFPTDIPITDYRTFDLKEHHPDVIFVHNIYDDTNFVTCIKEEYHTQVLRQYTDLLIYVPYFVTDGHVPETFRDLAGYYNVDYIIAQGTMQSEDYSPYIKNKVIPLGSPKFDKVLRTKICRENLPDDWKPHLREKTIFLNVSLTGFLTHNETMIKKLRYVLGIVREYEDKICLLFRPHPLTEPTLETMRPELLQPYRDLVADLEQTPNVIVDRTPIPETAIALSDAYIGEITSSIVPMFYAAEKPIMILNFTILGEEEEQPTGGGSIYYPPRDQFASNLDGTCGEKIYRFAMEKMNA